jgi:serine/threonine-protein kinase
MSAAPPQPSGPDAGTVIVQKYRLDRVIGTGGMATVLAATHLQLGEEVAVKVLHRHVLHREGAIARFLREARVAMRLKSEHVARVFDAGTMDDGTPFIVMELLQGADLATLLATRGYFPVDVAVDYLLQACQGLAEAHAAGVVHRDLKPANLFLCKSFDGAPCVKVLDFGVSKLLDADAVPNGFAVTASGPPSSDRVDAVGVSTPVAESDTVTLTQAFLGSPQYMAPEQIRSARDVDTRTDIWALGVILYELVSGERPFAGQTLPELTTDILRGDVPRLNVPGGSAPDLEATIDRCLAKHPSDRFADVREFAEAIAHLGSNDALSSLERILRMAQSRSAPPRQRASVRPAAAGAQTPVRATSATARVGRRGLALAGGAIAGAAALVFLPRLAGEPPAMPGSLEAASAPPSATVLESVSSVLAPQPAPSPEPRPATLPSSSYDGGAATRGESSAASPARVRAPSPPAGARGGKRPPASAPTASAGPNPDPALGLDTGALFIDRK